MTDTAAPVRSVHVVALGGTIAMTAEPAGGIVPTLDGPAIVAGLIDQVDGVEITTRSFGRVPGAHLTLPDVLALNEHIQQAVAAGCHGVVVTQGTDTIEETAFALDLLHSGEEPIVVTGAMRYPASPGADGPANVVAAVRIARHEQSRGLGVLVVMNDDIHAARFVRKSHTSRPSAFVSGAVGPIGWVAEDRVRLPLLLRDRVHVDAGRMAVPARVALVQSALGDDAAHLARLVDLGYSGLVVAGYGAGHASPGMAAAVAEAATHMPVVLASRTGAGETFRNTYGFAGSERDLLAHGLLSAGAIDAPKARVLLSLALVAGWSNPRIQNAFEILSGGAR